MDNREATKPKAVKKKYIFLIAINYSMLLYFFPSKTNLRQPTKKVKKKIYSNQFFLTIKNSKPF